MQISRRDFLILGSGILTGVIAKDLLMPDSSAAHKPESLDDYVIQTNNMLDTLKKVTNKDIISHLKIAYEDNSGFKIHSIIKNYGVCYYHHRYSDELEIEQMVINPPNKILQIESLDKYWDFTPNKGGPLNLSLGCLRWHNNLNNKHEKFELEKGYAVVSNIRNLLGIENHIQESKVSVKTLR